MFPDISWYERKNKIFININHYNYTNEIIKVDNNNINIKLEDNSETYSCILDLLEPIEKETVIIKKIKGIQLICIKLNKELKWKSLTKKNNDLIKIDWCNWNEEEENTSLLKLNNLISECVNYPNKITSEDLSSSFKNIIDTFECSDSE